MNTYSSQSDLLKHKPDLSRENLWWFPTASRVSKRSDLLSSPGPTRPHMNWLLILPTSSLTTSLDHDNPAMLIFLFLEHATFVPTSVLHACCSPLPLTLPSNITSADRSVLASHEKQHSCEMCEMCFVILESYLTTLCLNYFSC